MMLARLRALAPGESAPVAVLGLVALYVLLNTINFSLFVPGADWGPLWAGGQVAWTNAVQSYDFEIVSSLQEPLFRAFTDRPFVYPPSALLLFAPFALLPFKASFLLFLIPSLALFDRASKQVGASPVLFLLSPPLVLAAIAGQPTLLVAALLLIALVRLDGNQVQAGLLFGIAAMIKPPLLLLAPVALAGGGYWRCFAVSAATAVAIGLTSVAIFGFDPWLAWLSSLPKFDALVTSYEPLLRNAVTPYAAAVRLGVPTGAVTICAALIAIPIAWLTFARVRDTRLRLVALAGGALLLTPYAMNYELAALAPAVAAVRIRKASDLIVPELWAASLFVGASIVGLLAVYAWALAQIIPRLRSPVHDLPVQRRVDVPA